MELRLRPTVLCIVGALVCLPTPSGAQERDTAFRSLQEAREGDRLVVTGMDGVRVKGRLEVPADSMIVLQTRRGRVEFDSAKVAEVRQAQRAPREKRSWVGRHPVVTGMLVGAGAGTVVGLVAEPERTDLRGLTTAVGCGGGAGLGAMVGAVIGAARD